MTESMHFAFFKNLGLLTFVKCNDKMSVCKNKQKPLTSLKEK